MKAKEYLSRIGNNTKVTFVIAKAVKDENTPYYHTEYKTTPIFGVWEVEKHEWIEKYIVINAIHPPIDITGHWVREFNNGWLKCAIITTEQDLYSFHCLSNTYQVFFYYIFPASSIS